jgi:hypothetical protein
MRSANNRAKMSAPPPTVEGTMILIVCAVREDVTSPDEKIKIATASVATARRRLDARIAFLIACKRFPMRLYVISLY